MNICGIKCNVYEGDLNQYWINSIKDDTSYAPFYPTLLLSAYTLALMAKQLGYTHLVDIGSGDGRIAFCGKTVGIESVSIEVDEQLVNLQNNIMKKTNVFFKTINTDATQIKFASMGLIRPIFFIGGVPQNGEILAESIIKNMKKPLKFIQEVKQEAFKVTWPTGKETLQGTLMVVAMAIVASLFFLLLDQVLKFFLELILMVSI